MRLFTQRLSRPCRCRTCTKTRMCAVSDGMPARISHHIAESPAPMRLRTQLTPSRTHCQGLQRSDCVRAAVPIDGRRKTRIDWPTACTATKRSDDASVAVARFTIMSATTWTNRLTDLQGDAIVNR
jgi:hypothetical protein